MAAHPAVPGPRKAAIVALMLGDEVTSQMFRYLSEEEIERLAREMASLGPVPPAIGEQVLGEFYHTLVAAGFVTKGDVDQARRLLVKALGEDPGRRVMDKIVRSLQSVAGFASLEKADPEQLSNFVIGEHPQTIALILAHLNPESAAALITQLPDDVRADVLTRVASLEDIAPDVVSRISAVIEQRLQPLGNNRRREQHGGVRAVAELFNRLERTVSGAILQTIETSRPDLAVSIRNLMFVFDDLQTVDDAGIREMVQRADKKVLTLALKGASEELRQRFFTNMSKRSADLLKEELELLGAVRLREVEGAQQQMVAIARKLEEEGLIVTGAASGEAYVF